MSDFSGRGQVLEGDSFMNPSPYKSIVRVLYMSLLIQASVSYIFCALGLLFSNNSFRNHLLGLYALIFGAVALMYNLSYQPVKDRVDLFFPKFDEDVVKHTVYFLLGMPGVTKSSSFQYQLGSILFALVGFVGTMVSLRDQNLIRTYTSRGSEPYQQA